MGFTTDKQTLDDLNITGKYKPQSIFSLFNDTQTSGGEKLLDTLFHHPLSDPVAINSRSEVFAWFHNRKLLFPFNPSVIQVAETYLSEGISGSYLRVTGELLRKKFLHMAMKDEQYGYLLSGLLVTIDMLNTLQQFLETLDDYPSNKQYETVTSAFNGQKMIWLLETWNNQPLTLFQLARYDHLVRHVLRGDMENILDFIYHLDVYIAVSNEARDRGFSYAHALPKDQYIFQTTALHHPALKNRCA